MGGKDIGQTFQLITELERAADKPQADNLNVLIRALRLPWPDGRKIAVSALVTLGKSEAVLPLKNARETESDPEIKETMSAAITALEKAPLPEKQEGAEQGHAGDAAEPRA